jgi:hypothetical protein
MAGRGNRDKGERDMTSRQGSAYFATLSDPEKAALLHRRLLFWAGGYIDACMSDSENAAHLRTRSIVEICALGQAEQAILHGDATDDIGSLTCPPWLSHTRTSIEAFVNEKPRQRRALLKTWLFKPEMEDDLSRLVFYSIQGGSEEPSRYAAELLAGEVVVSL